MPDSLIQTLEMVNLVFQMQEDFFGNGCPEFEVGGLGAVLSSQIVTCIVKNFIENRLFHDMAVLQVGMIAILVIDLVGLRQVNGLISRHGVDNPLFLIVDIFDGQRAGAVLVFQCKVDGVGFKALFQFDGDDIFVI